MNMNDWIRAQAGRGVAPEPTEEPTERPIARSNAGVGRGGPVAHKPTEGNQMNDWLRAARHFKSVEVQGILQ
jgi:hypothetical protein